LIIAAGSGAMKPLWANSKEVLSENGSSFSSAAFACLVASSAGLGACCVQAEVEVARNNVANAAEAKRLPFNGFPEGYRTDESEFAQRMSFMMTTSPYIEIGGPASKTGFYRAIKSRNYGNQGSSLHKKLLAEH